MLRVNNRRQAGLYQGNLDGGLDPVGSKRRKSFKEEALHQQAFFAMRARWRTTYPDLRFVFSTLNGIFLPAHLRREAIRAGLDSGILDIWSPILRDGADGRYCGLAMDLKVVKNGRPSPAQIEWSAHLVRNGWHVTFPAGVVAAWRTCCCYTGISGAAHAADELLEVEEEIAEIKSAYDREELTGDGMEHAVARLRTRLERLADAVR